MIKSLGTVTTFLNQGSAIAALCNTPFREYKTSNYEGGIASPLIAHWPKGLKRKGRLNHQLYQIADIMPTCLELAGLQYPKTHRQRTLSPLVGCSLVSALTDSEEKSGRTVVWPNAIRQGNWKLVLHRKSPELFDLNIDRNELRDLSAQYPEKVIEMKAHHKQLKN